MIIEILPLRFFKPQLVALLLITNSLISSCYSGSPIKNTFSGTVTKVHDGDSIHITPPGKNRVIIRLAAIDAPEIKQTHGIQSRDYLRRLIMNKQVTAKCNKLDKYNRHVCVVTSRGQDANLSMLESGHAWYYERFKNEQSGSDQRSYQKAAGSAKKQALGLWQNPKAIAPWEFRSITRY